jgi:hypothetical protein
MRKYNLKKLGGSVFSRFPIAKTGKRIATTAPPSTLGRTGLSCSTQPADQLLKFAQFALPIRHQWMANIINGWRSRMCTGDGAAIGQVIPARDKIAGANDFAVCYSASVTTSESAALQQRVGLCADCLHSRRIESDRGSVFFLCQLALSNPQFQKYPRLPVLSCPGYEKTRPA